MKGINRLLAFLMVCVLLVSACGALPALQPANDSKREVASYAVPPAAPTAVAGPDRASGVKAPVPAESTSVGTMADRLIIRNGNITLIVKDVQQAISDVTEVANGAGGLVLSSSSQHKGGDLYATVTIKVPVEAFDDVLAKLRKLAVKVDADNSSSQDVTEEYVDLEARLKVYEATEQQLLRFLDRTQNVDEALKVYRELNTVRSNIESLKGRMNYLAKSAAMSTIVVQLRPVPKDAPIVKEEGFNLLRTIRDALRGLVSALEVVVVVILWAIFFLVPIVALLGVLFWFGRAVWRRVRRKAAR